jgi:hypothetical protein
MIVVVDLLSPALACATTTSDIPSMAQAVFMSGSAFG